MSMTATVKAVRFSPDDVQLLEAVQAKLGCRSASELLRMGLRSIAREQGIIVKGDQSKPDNAAEKA